MTIGDICPIIREEIITLSKYEIDFYRKNDNTCPMEDFLNSLEYKMRAKMLRLIMLLEQNGNELREPYSKFLSDGIYELRARQGNNTSIEQIMWRGEMNMSDFKTYLDKQLHDIEYKKEWDNLEPEFNTIQAMIDARKRCNMTQKELSEITGIDQSDISKIEKGNANPSLSTLKRLAAGMNTILKLEFIPKSNN